ncbi:MAG: bifunctional 4-hydroxy-2-oxoglutarate aldolase/2-dehydro-3-deoxy-phosphogluconate aldolase [Ardenticatenaceae bacterium]|nr:bifunctional 4-hydroxy-2-oxoglutarate aldolase/2-dehydro-3-deoxy-phosphogluconate aldolase [Ardenticatenaceae bacterium]
MDTITQLYNHGLISIIRGDFTVVELTNIAEALLKGGVRCIEITLNSRHALAGIAACRRAFGDDVLIGAGTVRTAEDVKKAVDAGSLYLIAPCLDLPAVKEAARHQRLLIPGIFTATEAQAAFVAGCRTVKLFPADAFGPKYLRALRAPLDHIDFIPTGGVNSASINDFHQAGAVAFGVGSALVKNVPIYNRELTALTARATALKAALDEARSHE